MTYTRHHMARLTADEIRAASAIVEKHGKRRATELLGLRAEGTLAKALAGWEVDSLTASTIRSNLPRSR